MTVSGAHRPVLAFSLKMYFGAATPLDWCKSVGALLERTPGIASGVLALEKSSADRMMRPRIDGWSSSARPASECQILNKGTAGPGLLAQLWGSVDGLFLGRRAHDPNAFGEVLRGAAGIAARTTKGV